MTPQSQQDTGGWTLYHEFWPALFERAGWPRDGASVAKIAAAVGPQDVAHRADHLMEEYPNGVPAHLDYGIQLLGNHNEHHGRPRYNAFVHAAYSDTEPIRDQQDGAWANWAKSAGFQVFPLPSDPSRFKVRLQGQPAPLPPFGPPAQLEQPQLTSSTGPSKPQRTAFSFIPALLVIGGVTVALYLGGWQLIRDFRTGGGRSEWVKTSEYEEKSIEAIEELADAGKKFDRYAEQSLETTLRTSFSWSSPPEVVTHALEGVPDARTKRLWDLLTELEPSGPQSGRLLESELEALRARRTSKLAEALEGGNRIDRAELSDLLSDVERRIEQLELDRSLIDDLADRLFALENPDSPRSR